MESVLSFLPCATCDQTQISQCGGVCHPLNHFIIPKTHSFWSKANKQQVLHGQVTEWEGACGTGLGDCHPDHTSAIETSAQLMERPTITSHQDIQTGNRHTGKRSSVLNQLAGVCTNQAYATPHLPCLNQWTWTETYTLQDKE